MPADVLPVMKAKQLTLAVDLGADARFDIHAAYVDAGTAQDAEKAIKSLADLGRKELAKKKKELEDKLHDPDNKRPRPADELPEAAAQVFAIGAVTRLDETLADPKLITRDKAELAVAVPLPKEVLVVAGGLVAVGVGALIPTGGLDKFTEGFGRTASNNNLKQIMLAIHNYHDAVGQLPADIVDKNGKPLLSWRVAILPYIEQDAALQTIQNG